MWKENNFVKLPVVLDRITRHPLMKDITLEAAIQYTIDFIDAMGLPDVYLDKQADVHITNYRGTLPCDCVAISQVKWNNKYLVSMLSTGSNDIVPAFRTEGTVIFTTMKNADIVIYYKAIAVDEEGMPLLPDNSLFLKALELYIKKEWFTILFDMGKIRGDVLSNTQQEYYLKAGQCNNEYLIPSVSEMQAITNMFHRLIPDISSFYRGFREENRKEIRKF